MSFIVIEAMKQRVQGMSIDTLGKRRADLALKLLDVDSTGIDRDEYIELQFIEMELDSRWEIVRLAGDLEYCIDMISSMDGLLKRALRRTDLWVKEA